MWGGGGGGGCSTWIEIWCRVYVLSLRKQGYSLLMFNTPCMYHTTGIDDKPKIRLFLDFPTKRGPIRIPDRIGNKYSDYGIFLLADDTGSRVDAIKSKHQLDYNSIIEEITREWLEGSGVKPVTWRTLVQVLKQIRLVTLAQEIEEAFQN